MCRSDAAAAAGTDGNGNGNGITTTTADSPLLYKCSPEPWLLAWPRWLRFSVGYLTMVAFSFSFMALPAMSLLALLCHALGATYAGGSLVALLLISFIMPSYEWKSFRKVGQLWYELLDFRTNLSPERIAEIVHSGDSAQFIAGMHPHGIIPFHAMLYAAFCDQYLTSGGRSLYGFGAGANVVLYLPLLKHIMSWLSVTGADYESLRDRLADYKAHSNSRHSSAKHLFILPGGIAEVLVSAPKTHIVVFKRRRGLIKLALETGAHLAPIYVFGGTDFFHNLISGDNFVGRVSRRLRMGISVFYGPWFLPVPYTPRITFCYAEVVCVEKWDLSKGPIPEELIDELHCKYMKSLSACFDTYKASAGYPDATLRII